MLLMSTSGSQRNLHIRNLRPGQHARMTPFRQMSQNQPLPVPIQLVLAAAACKSQTASRLAGLQDQMYLRIMAQGFEMTHSLHYIFDGFLVYNTACPKLHRNAKALLHQAF